MYFGIQSFHYVGSWHEQMYQATVFLRVVCNTNKAHTIRMVVSLHAAPAIQANAENAAHSETPAWYLTAPTDSSGNLPRVWFQGPDNFTVEALAHDWEYHARKMTTTALIASAELPADVPFVIHMQGSERVYHVQQSCSPRQHQLFSNQAVWLGVVASEKAFESLESRNNQRAAPKRQLVHRTALQGASDSSGNSGSGAAGITAGAASSSSSPPVQSAPSDLKRFLVLQVGPAGLPMWRSSIARHVPSPAAGTRGAGRMQPACSTQVEGATCSFIRASPALRAKVQAQHMETALGQRLKEDQCQLAVFGLPARDWLVDGKPQLWHAHGVVSAAGCQLRLHQLELPMNRACKLRKEFQS